MKTKKSMIKLIVAAALFLAAFMTYNTANSWSPPSEECYTCIGTIEFGYCSEEPADEPGYQICTVVDNICGLTGEMCGCEQGPGGEQIPCEH